MKIVVFFSGTGTNLESILNKQADYGYEVISAFTNNPNAEGIKICGKYGTQCEVIDHRVFKSREDFDNNVSKFLERINPDYIILAGYMRIISESLVNDWEGQIINIHPSLLPKYPGLNTHQKALEAKDEYHGTTIHYVINELDAGPIIRQESFKIELNDTVKSLTDRVKQIENRIYPETISKLI
tara:strand:- start:548 stop:1099 length:552 start_codon:yes stop_codon:yes gene_type:complete